MPIEVLDRLDDQRPFRVRHKIVLGKASRTWKREPAVPMAAGGTIKWVFEGLSEGDQVDIRFKGKPGELPKPRPEDAGLPDFPDPLETKVPSSNAIVGTIFRDARGRYSYVVVVNGEEFRCVPDGMGGVDVSGPPGP